MQLSVIIVSYNSPKVLAKCLVLLRARLIENFEKSETEIIVVDNNSGSKEQAWLKKQPDVRLACLKENIGFGRANNVGLQMAKGQYVLFLNSDLYLEKPVDFRELLAFLGSHERYVGLTIKIRLPNGKLDWASHRGFPTPGNAMAYFLGLEKLFGGYHLLDRDLTATHEIDSGTAAFLLIKKKILDHLHGFDPDYFFYGEDLDLCYRLKQLGYSIWYYPKYEALHLKYQSGQKSRDREAQTISKAHFYKTMLTFYDKHLAQKYPRLLSVLVRTAIKLRLQFAP